ncbi:hypothetical protein I4U23_030744 [Adineta vaga]|nr:hypothetical protein I4U23_030744 [Adineta vaga]
MTICLGIPFLIAGLLGACLNIIVFLSLKTFRQSSCAFFLTIMSFVNIGQLLTGLLSRILIMDLTSISQKHHWHTVNLEIIVFNNVIAVFTYYLYFTNPFYIYICVSKRFRQQLNYVICTIHKKERHEEAIAVNHVSPMSEMKELDRN